MERERERNSRACKRWCQLIHLAACQWGFALVSLVTHSVRQATIPLKTHTSARYRECERSAIHIPYSFHTFEHCPAGMQGLTGRFTGSQRPAAHHTLQQPRTTTHSPGPVSSTSQELYSLHCRSREARRAFGSRRIPAPPTSLRSPTPLPS